MLAEYIISSLAMCSEQWLQLICFFLLKLQTHQLSYLDIDCHWFSYLIPWFCAILVEFCASKVSFSCQLLHDTIFKLLHHGLPNSYMHLKFGWLRSWLRACVSNIVIIQFLYCCWGAKNHETIKYFNCCQCYIFIHCTSALD